MYVTNDSGCSTGGAWEAYGTSKSSYSLSAGDGLKNVYVKYKDATGLESSCVNSSINLDSTAPAAPDALALQSPGSSPGVSLTPTISVGSNLEVGATVKLYTNSGCTAEVGSITASSSSMNIVSSSLTEGEYVFYAKQIDVAGNASSCSSASVGYRLDLHQPVASLISVDFGGSSNATYATSTSVTLSISATDATQMYITNTVACSGGGVWDTYSTSPLWTLSAGDGSKAVYVKFRNALGTESACINDSILLDSTSPSKPSAMSLLSPATSPNSVAQPTIQISGVVDGDTVQLFNNDNTCGVSNQIASGVVATSQTIISLQSSSLTDGSYTFYAKSTDPAGNSLGCSVVNVAYVLDSTAPTSPTGITLGAATAATTETPVLSWTAATDSGGTGVASYQVQIYNASNVAVGSPTTLVSGNIITSLSLTATATYYVKVRAVDSAGNVGAYSAASSNWTATGADNCTGTPAIGTQCADGTYYVGTITISGSTYKLATTPSGCGYESGGSASTSPTSLFAPTCSGGADTMTKNAVAMTPASGADQASSYTAKSTVSGSTSTSLIVAASATKPAYAYCKYLNYGGKTDWFLPNRSELHLMACHGTTSASPMSESSSNDDIHCASNGYGSGSDVVPNFKSGSANAAGFAAYHTSTTASWGGSGNILEQTVNGAYSGTQTVASAGTGYLVRCMRVIP